MTNCGEFGHEQGACGNASCSRGGFDCLKCGIGPGHTLPCVCPANKKPAWAVTQAEQNAMNADQWESWKRALKGEAAPPVTDELFAEMYATLVEVRNKFDSRPYGTGSHIRKETRERVKLVVEAAQPAKEALVRRIMEARSDRIRGTINGAMGGRQPVPWSGQQSPDDTPHE